MKHTPFYYRWAWSPSTGDVTLSHNKESPHYWRYHHVMANERPEKDLVLGYAGRLRDGWKIMDADWKEVEEPGCASDVEQAIRQLERT